MPGIVVRVNTNTGKLDALIASTPRADEMIARRAAVEVAQGARSRAPVRSGELKGSIQFDGAGSTYFVEASAGHALFVEMGTRKMASQPYLVPAVEAVNYNAIAMAVLRSLGW